MSPSQGAEGSQPPAPSAHAPAAAADTAPSAPPPVAEEEDAGLFSIIDESGEGWGFELTPSTVAKPLALLGGVLFAVGAMAGVPAGIALGRSAAAAEDNAVAPPPTPAGLAGRRGGGGVTPSPPAVVASAGAKPSAARAELSGVLFAAKAFGLGTLLCMTGGAAAVYATHWSLGVNSIEDFAAVMREAVPRRREALEDTLAPVVGGLRGAAGGALPPVFDRARDRFQASGVGRWVRTHLESAVTIVDADEEGTAGEGAAGAAGSAGAAVVASGEGPAAAAGLVGEGGGGEVPVRLLSGGGVTPVVVPGGGGVVDPRTEDSGRREEGRAPAPQTGLPPPPLARSPRALASPEGHAPHDDVAATATPVAPPPPRPDGRQPGVARPLGAAGPAATAPAGLALFRVATNARRGQALEPLLVWGSATDAPGAGRPVG